MVHHIFFKGIHKKEKVVEIIYVTCVKLAEVLAVKAKKAGEYSSKDKLLISIF